jgi:hypothetical protein
VRPELFSRNVDYRDDVVRNIPGVRRAQNPFDDLSADPDDWQLASSVEAAQRASTPDTLISDSFDYGGVVSYTFESKHWHATRFSDGALYGVWYGSLELETTVYETAWHWYRFVTDSFPNEDREVVTERRVFDVRCNAVLIDLRGKEASYPNLRSRKSYAFTQQVGRYLHEQNLNGLLVRSARCDGTNAAIFRPERLSNVRERAVLTYRLNAVRDSLVAERRPGTAWLRLSPSKLG